MSNDTRATFRLSEKDFHVIELIQRKQYVRIADQLFRSHENIVARMEARFDELERKLDQIEAD
jgi:type IV secretory pathway VirD2 relaxase